MASPTDWPRRSALITGTASGLLGLVVLVGWSVHYVPLIQISPALAPMQRMTALGFLFCGLALVLMSTERRRLAAMCAALPFLIAALTSLEYFFDADFGIDQLLGKGYITVLAPQPGRMSPVTALCFLLISSALATVAFRPLARYVSSILGIVGSVVVTVGLVSGLSYLIAQKDVYVWGHIARVALHARAGFLLLGAGLLAVGWKEKARSSYLPNWLPLSAGLAVSVGVLGLWQAFILHEESKFALLSWSFLAGGFVVALFFGITVYLAQAAWSRNRQLLIYRMAFENSFDGFMLTSPEGAIHAANPSACRIFGRTEQEICQAGREGIIDTSDPSLQILIEERARTGKGHGELRAKRKDGTLFPVEISSVAFKDTNGEIRTSLALRDISAHKQAEAELRESEERFRRVFEEGPMGLALVATDYRLLKVNNMLCQRLGYMEAELLGLTFADFTHPDDLQADVNLAEQLFANQIPYYQMEKRYFKKSGEIIWVRLTSSVIRDHQGNILYALAMVEDITGNKQAEQKLKEQAALLELAHDAVIVRDLQARVVFWNRGAKDMYGWSAEEALGRMPHELLQTVFPVPPQEIETVVKEQGQWEGELVHRTRAGKTIVVASRWSLQRDQYGAPRSILEINRNITARKHAEAELKIQTERLSLATRAASIGIWDLDLRTNLTVWDDTLFELFGIPKVVPMPYERWAGLVHPDDLPNAEASLERTIRLKTQDDVEFRIIRPDGSLRHISSAQGVVLDEHGNPIRIVGVGMDITERKRMEAQLAATARLSALGMMAGGVAHEINNPLAIIHASASDLLDTAKEEGHVPEDVVVRTVTRIRQTADRIARIVKSMRRIARDGSQDPFFSVHVSKIIEQTLEVCQAKFKDQSVALRLPALDPHLQIACREVQISQVLLNLLTNALDAVAGQPGEKWVRMNIERRDESIVLSVVDSGPGVVPELKARIMEPFFTTKEVGKGTGLGLSLSRTIAEEHGGKLEVTEDHGHTCFSLTLPVSERRKRYAA
jgi:PAS domain S-box-containing protein